MDYRDSLAAELGSIVKINIVKLEPFVKSLYDKTEGRIITTGMGKAGIVASALASTLCSVGYSSSFLHPAEAQHGDLGIITMTDTLLCFSNSGKTKEVLETIDLAKAWIPDIKVFSVVGVPDSLLSMKSYESFCYGPVDEICPLGLVPTTSTTCMSVVCDMIVAHFTELNLVTKELYNQLHHGGYLGVKSSNI